MNHNEAILERRRIAWFNRALDCELNLLRSLPPGHNVNRPGCQFWRSLFAIAGLVKGGHIQYQVALEQVRGSTRHLSRLSDKVLNYQYSRAVHRAIPRRFVP